MLALLEENGPCKVVGRKGEAWEMARREYSWVDAANVLWVDQPGGVGFSDRPPVPGLARDEHDVAESMLGFMQSFFAKFPRYASQPFFIFGESYAGHYVPAVAARILHAQQAGFQVHLEGVGIGNGLVSPGVQFASKPVMAVDGGGASGSLQGKGFVSIAEFGHMEEALPKCEAMIHECQTAIPRRDQTVCLSAYMFCTTALMAPVSWAGVNPYDLRIPCIDKPMCYNETLATEFMNDPKVQKALGFAQPRPWEPCNMTVNMQFVASGDFFRDLRPQVVELLAAGVGVLVYNGDDDFMVDWVGSKLWMENLEWPHSKEWSSALDGDFLPKADGGARGKVRSAAGLTFVQVYESGHMVPMDQPSVALEMLRTFVAPGSPWRRFVGEAAPLDGAAIAPGQLSSSLAMFGIAVVAASGLLAVRGLHHRQGAEERPYYVMA